MFSLMRNDSCDPKMKKNKHSDLGEGCMGTIIPSFLLQLYHFYFESFNFNMGSVSRNFNSKESELNQN